MPPLYNLLYPLARILLRQGVTAHEFSRVANRAFVLAAVDALKQQGKHPSFSRVSTLTGLHRHAVSDILTGEVEGAPAMDEAKEYQRHRLARVLTGWFEDPRYTDHDGRPRQLQIVGPAPSFESLVKDFSGDIYPSIILDELEQVGAVVRNSDATVSAVSRRYSAGGVSQEAMHHMEGVAADLLRTLEHNMSAPAGDRLLEDSAIIDDFPVELVPILRRTLKRRATAFLDDVEGWLSQHEATSQGSDDSVRGVRAGVRVVMVVDPPPVKPPTGD